jgi:hypothetical protein
MGEILTMSEIENRFPNEWVLLGDPETTPALKVVKGKVLWHGKDQDELYRVARELRPERSAYVHTGELPKDVAYAL